MKGEGKRGIHRARARATRARRSTGASWPFAARRAPLGAFSARHGSTAPISPRCRRAQVVDAKMMTQCSETVPRAVVRAVRPLKRVRNALGREGSRGPSPRRSAQTACRARASASAPEVIRKVCRGGDVPSSRRRSKFVRTPRFDSDQVQLGRARVLWCSWLTVNTLRLSIRRIEARPERDRG